MGSHGHRVDFDAAHDWACILNAIQGMGSVGTVFHACCLLETTTLRFHIRTLPIVAHGYKTQGRFNWLLPQVIALRNAVTRDRFTAKSSMRDNREYAGRDHARPEVQNPDET